MKTWKEFKDRMRRAKLQKAETEKGIINLKELMKEIENYKKRNESTYL